MIVLTVIGLLAKSYVVLAHQAEQSWWWRNYPCGMINPSTNYAGCTKAWKELEGKKKHGQR